MNTSWGVAGFALLVILVLPVFWRRFQASRGTAERASIRTERIQLPGNVQMEMVWIPPGTFVMGAPETEMVWRPPGSTFADFGDKPAGGGERPQHQVTFNSGFWMGKYPVTQAQWRALMSNNPSHFLGDKLPVEKVSWRDAQKFVAGLNAYTGATYRLPSEAEWEYACRAGTTTRFYWGDDPGVRLINAYAWHLGNSGGKTHDVGGKKPNSFGLHDMIGNVAEYCDDFYHSDYQGAPTDGSAWVSPPNPDRVDRGGAFGGDTTCDYRSAARGICGVTIDFFSVYGFRVVRADNVIHQVAPDATDLAKGQVERQSKAHLHECKKCGKEFPLADGNPTELTQQEQILCAKHNLPFARMKNVTCPHCGTHSLMEIRGSGSVQCACCSKPLKPPVVPGGSWSGTLKEFQKVKLTADNGFICEKCGKGVCVTCSGQKASSAGVRAFVCTECGHYPLKTLFR